MSLWIKVYIVMQMMLHVSILMAYLITKLLNVN